jgi:hypothetical protein
MNDSVIEFLEKNKNLKINGIALQRKSVSGEFIDEIGLTVYVDKKKPLNEIDPKEIIPTGFYSESHGWIKMDVLEGKDELLCSSCQTTGSVYTQNSIPVLSSLRAHRSPSRPVLGGVSICSMPVGSLETHSNAGWRGTLGFLAVDELDESLVGITNGHVAAFDSSNNFASIQANERVIGNPRYSAATDNYNFSGYRIEQSQRTDFTLEMMRRQGKTDQATFDHYVTGHQGGVYRSALNIGYLKRYIPLSLTGFNLVENAVIGLDLETANGIIKATNQADQNIGTQILSTENSWKIANTQLVNNQIYYPFATTEEINSMTGVAFRNEGVVHPNIVTAGRTTGSKGNPANALGTLTNPACVYECTSLNYVSLNINFFNNNISQIGGNLSFKFRNCTNTQPIQGGDSGSVVLARFNNIWKIVGTAYASGPSEFRVSRIDNIAKLLKIKPYLGQPIRNPSRNGVSLGRSLIVRNKQSLPFFTHTDGRVYYQFGTTSASSQLNWIPEAPSVPSVPSVPSCCTPNILNVTEVNGNTQIGFSLGVGPGCKNVWILLLEYSTDGGVTWQVRGYYQPVGSIIIPKNRVQIIYRLSALCGEEGNFGDKSNPSAPYAYTPPGAGQPGNTAQLVYEIIGPCAHKFDLYGGTRFFYESYNTSVYTNLLNYLNTMYPPESSLFGGWSTTIPDEPACSAQGVHNNTVAYLINDPSGRYYTFGDGSFSTYAPPNCRGGCSCQACV